jgi:ribosomal protein S18 acetylase RimI-like enzyme
MPALNIRNVEESDLDACFEVETACWPPEEAALKETIGRRIRVFPQGFFVAETDGRVVGMLNSCSTNREELGDESLKQLVGHDVNGRNMVVFALGVLPEYRKHGIAAELMRKFIAFAKALQKDKVLLICKSYLVPYYERFGFAHTGLSASCHGGTAWQQMALKLEGKKEARPG